MSMSNFIVSSGQLYVPSSLYLSVGVQEYGGKDISRW